MPPQGVELGVHKIAQYKTLYFEKWQERLTRSLSMGYPGVGNFMEI